LSKTPANLLSVREIAARFGVSKRTIERLVAEGELAKIKIGSRTLFERSEAERYLQQNTRRAQ